MRFALQVQDLTLLNLKYVNPTHGEIVSFNIILSLKAPQEKIS